MHRREMFATLGKVGLGFSIEKGVVSAAEHGSHADGPRLALPSAAHTPTFAAFMS
jgi:hypothetical protein